ncbi:MAG: S-adenosylmethionine decarboxylase proenzyme [bacterium]|jgi:S-adenosylmethionine decarboxylase proenzyme
MKSLGRHILAEFYGCEDHILNDVELIQKTMEQSAIISGATIVDSSFHMFSPYGVSGAVIIAESHLAIHTWPEYSYAAIDLFTCGTTVDPWIAFEHLKAEFKAQDCKTVELTRGQFDEIRHKMLVSNPKYSEISNDQF